MATFAEIITALREEKGKKRQEVADDLGISRASLEYYEKGKRKPDIEVLAKVADYYGVSADYLLGRTNAKTTDKDLRFVCDYTKLNETSIKTLHSNWGMSVEDIIDFLLSGNGYSDFLDFCIDIRKYKLQFNELLDSQESIMNDRSKAPSSFSELQNIISSYDSLQNSKDLTEFRLQKCFRNMLNSYCKAEVEKDNKYKVDFQKTYDYLINDYMQEYLLTKAGDDNAHNPETKE